MPVRQNEALNGTNARARQPLGQNQGLGLSNPGLVLHHTFQVTNQQKFSSKLSAQ
jgi:hypothetical protein